MAESSYDSLSGIIVLAQTFSPCGKFLVCGNNYGDIAIYNLTDILHNAENLPNKCPNFIFTSLNHEQICSMASTKKFCIVGTVGTIYGWNWDSIKACKPELQWKISLPKSQKNTNQDINSLLVTEEGDVNFIYAGCGDNLIYVFSLEDGKYLRKFEGHTDYIHSISHFESQMASSGEDGSVRLWDIRQHSMIMMIEPSSEAKLARPQLGKWIGDVDINSKSLTCGGGPQAGLWDLRNLELIATFQDTDDAAVHITRFTENSVLLGGNAEYFFRFNTDGEVLSKISTSSDTIYSAVYLESPTEVLSLAGSSQNIDLCTDFAHRYQVLNFSKDFKD